MKKLLLTIATLLTVNLCLTAQEPMVLTYNTNLSAGTTITLPLNGTVNVTVNWGDGNEETFTSAGMKNHTFVDEGTYTVQITGTLTRFGGGDFTGYSNAEKLVSVTSFGELGLTSLSYAFSGAKNLVSVPSQIPTTVTNLSYMFNNANKFNQDISEWNVSNITDMSGMFRVASTFNQDIGNWDVSNVKNMSNMFNQAVRFNQNLNSWDVSKVTNMWQMFTLAYDFNGIIGDWNVGSVTNISSMFYYATSFNQDISGWNVSNVIDMSSMFCSASAFNQDIGNWDVSSVTTMRYLFRQASHFNQDIGGWNVGNVTNMHQMFFLATSFNQDISSWDVGKVTDMSNMFASASKFNQNLGSWNVTNVTNMTYMFNGIKLSTPNYNAILEGWASQAVKSGVIFSGGNSKYSPGAPVDARNALTGFYGWIISDGGVSYLPAISTSEIYEISLSSATSGGNITNDGGTDVSARGVVWNTSANPTIDNNAGITTDGTGTGTFQSSITGLSENITYYVRAYATNSTGTDYGVQKVFTTPNPMTLEFNTTLSDGTTVSLPLYGTVDVTVYWGDGNEETFSTSGIKDHIYSSEGTYTVKIIGTLTHFGGGDFNGYSNVEKLVSVSSFGEIGLTSLSYAFNCAKNLTSVPTSIPASVTNLSGMFDGASKFNQDISSWDVSNVTNMAFMFRRASAFNQNINNWNVGNVTNMSNMFCQASNFNQNLNSWDVSKVTNMWQMFASASSFNGAIGNWDVSSLTNPTSLFYYASSFNQDISNWNLSSATSLQSMFCGADAFNQDISNWDVSKVTNMKYMFRQASAFNQDISGWNVGNVTSMEQMFFYASSFNQDISQWNVGKVTNMSSMFSLATKFNQNIGGWDVSKVTNMSSMFNNASTFNQDLGDWDISSVTDLSSMFYNITLSTAFYNSILNSWAEKAVMNSVTFDGGKSKYSPGSAATARGILTDTFGWTITDGGESNLPAIITSSPTEITVTSAISGGNVTADAGSAVTERGIVWNVTKNPTTDSNLGIATSGLGLGNFTAAISDLEEYTTYYVRAYATNANGTAYGTNIEFSTKKEITVEGSFTAYNKTYNGSTSANINENYLSLAGLLPEYSDVTVSSVNLVFDGPEASQDSKIVSISQVVLGGTDAEKYHVSLAGSPTSTALINPKNLTVIDATAQSKTYDGNNVAQISNAILWGVVSGDDVELSNYETGTFAQVNVGNGIEVSTNMSITGDDISNYTFTQPNGFTANILPKELTVNGVTGISTKTYDGNSTATIIGNPSLNGIVNGDNSEVAIESVTANFSDKNMGTAKEVTVTVTLQGSKASNYTVANLTSLTADIMAKELTVDGAFTVANRVYNGTQAASIESNSFTLTGVIADEIVTLSPVAAFADKNVGEGKTVNLSNETTIVGEDSGNYILSFTNAPTSTASIIAKELSVINALVSNKVYDGNVNAAISGAELNGVIEGDEVFLENQNSGTFSQKNVGTDIDVTTAMTISGTDATNYTISQPTGLKADITALELTIGGTFTVENKVFDGTTAATIVENNLILLTPIAGDDVSLINVVAKFENENIGEGISVTISSAEIDGTDINNYTLTLANAPETKGNILEPAPETFTVTFTVSNNEGAVSGATISINEQTLTTNESGVATINLENGTYSYSVSASNFTTYDGSITVDGADLSEDVSLVHVGIGENSLANLSAFPNPFSNDINIANAVNAAKVVVCNIIGEVVMNVELNQSGNIRLETSKLNSGIYLVTILANDGSRIVKKMIKR